jgi:hypothetical protein
MICPMPISPERPTALGLKLLSCLAWATKIGTGTPVRREASSKWGISSGGAVAVVAPAGALAGAPPGAAGAPPNMPASPVRSASCVRRVSIWAGVNVMV